MSGDLHAHTTFSDGSLTADSLVKLAKNVGLSHVAITDHDNLFDKEKANELFSKYKVNVINGVEVSSKDRKRDRRVHILCYMPKKEDELKNICQITAQNRMQAGLEMAELISKRFPVTVEDIKAQAGESKSIFKQHIMQTIMNAGYATQMYGELYKELFNLKDGSCMIPCKQPDVYEVLDIVKKSGGVCVMAHPFTYDSIDFLNEIIKENYLDGIEVWSSKSNKEQEEYLLNLCNENGLIPTGGSDFHGANTAVYCPLGVKRTPEDSIKRIYELLR